MPRRIRKSPKRANKKAKRPAKVAKKRQRRASTVSRKKAFAGKRAFAAAPKAAARLRAAPTVLARMTALPFDYPPVLKHLISASPALMESTESLGKTVSFTVAPKTVSNEPIQAQRGVMHERKIDDFRPRKDSVELAVERLKQLGFQIGRIGRFGISASGPAKLVSDVLGIRLAVQARPRRSSIRSIQNFATSFDVPQPEDLFVAPRETLTVKTTISDHIDDVVFIPPPLHFAAPNPSPPAYTFPGVDATRIHQLLNVPPGLTGKGVKVALVDTGFFSHPYYAAKGFDYQPTPAPQVDAYGHGTAIAYNVFAVAPEVTVMGFQETAQPQDALEAAAAATAGVDIISCSWGWENEQTFPILEATIRDIVNTDGKIVLFAAGNGQQCWPASMPEVLAVGGVYADPGGNLEASNYASGFASNVYPGRRVPDVSGLCGQQPKGIYIMMPCPPGCTMDQMFAGPTFPDGDQTAADDGWVAASGTSSATPQIAGVAALLVQAAKAKGKTLHTDDVRKLLEASALSVQAGKNAQGFPAVGQPNIAVGYGLVDAGKAIAAV